MLTENVLDLGGNIIASKRFDDDADPGTTYEWEDMYFFYHYDVRGSVTAIVDPDGDPVKQYTYDEFGNLTASGKTSFDNEVTFTSSITDTSTGLQYMNARYYEPTTGRFLTQDTYTGNAYEPWTQHLYTYCGSNPTNMVDPTRHRPIRGDDPNDEIWTRKNGEWKYLGSRKAERLIESPKPLTWEEDNETTYAGESDLSVIARLLYGEDSKSTEAHLWVLENRRITNEKVGYSYFTGGTTYRGLALGNKQFSCMDNERSLDPAAIIAESPKIEQEAWDKCVDAAFKFLEEGIGAITKPKGKDDADFTYGWTHAYDVKFVEDHKDGIRHGGTWFYHRQDDPYKLEVKKCVIINCC